jgi:pyruvate-formate lyase-activating enzyme
MLKIFDLELASPCNAKCNFCPQKWRGVTRSRPFMDEALIDKVTREIGEMARVENVHAVLCGMGENLTRKHLVLRALEGLQRHSDGRISTLLVTNGSTLTADLAEHEAFRRLGAIQVSFAGPDKESYEALYGLKWEKVIDNVLTMNRLLPGKIYLRTVDLEAFRDRRDAFERAWNAHGITVSFRPLHSRGGYLDDPEAYRGGAFRSFVGCEIFDWIHFISSDGQVLSCCHDVTSANVVGDANVSTLAEIMEHKRALRAERFAGYDICTKCTDFELATVGAGGARQI